MKVLIVGAYPPPIGGNSVHIKRLREEIHAHDFSCDVVDIYGMPSETHPTDEGVCRIGPAGIFALLKAIVIMRKKPYDVIHFHVSAMDRFAYAGLILLLAIPAHIKSILTIHSGQFSDNYRSSPSAKRWLMRALFKKFDHIITVNNEQRLLLISLGIEENAVDVIPAYIPPTIELFPAAEQVIARLRIDNRLVILSSGYGEPLYGYHTIVAAIKDSPLLKEKVSLLLCLYNTFTASYMAELKASMSELSSAEIMYDLTPEQFAYTLSKCDIYVRATDSDGDAVAVREAAHFDVPVIASDSSERPDFCAIFRCGDPSDLALKLVSKINSEHESLQPVDSPASNADRIIKIYQAPKLTYPNQN